MLDDVFESLVMDESTGTLSQDPPTMQDDNSTSEAAGHLKVRLGTLDSVGS